VENKGTESERSVQRGDVSREIRVLHKKELTILYSSNYFVIVGKSGASLLAQLNGRLGEDSIMQKHWRGNLLENISFEYQEGS